MAPQASIADASNSPPFKADTATLVFSASKDGKLPVNYAGREANKIVLEGQVFEVC
jgi:hypothetical protein